MEYEEGIDCLPISKSARFSDNHGINRFLPPIAFTKSIESETKWCRCGHTIREVADQCRLESHRIFFCCIESHAQRCYNEFGIEIVDVLEIHNGGIIYLASANEKFISPHENLPGRKEGEGTDIPLFLGQFAVGPVFCNVVNNSQLTLCSNAETAECVVMKWIPKTALNDLDVVKKLEAEAQSLTALSHACITKLLSRLDTATYVVFIFDPWKGTNLKKHMCARGKNDTT